MKRIGILSDTHSFWDDKYVQYFSGCDEIWHAGDIGEESLIDRLENIAPVRAVCGNCDGGMLRRRFKVIECFTVEGVKVWLTHVGGYPGKYAPGVKATLEYEKPQLMVCGHSHILKVMPDPMLGLLHINPGAAGKQGWQVVRTLVIVTLDEGTIKDCEVIELADNR